MSREFRSFKALAAPRAAPVDAGRLVTVKDNGVTAATYAHNALGQRVIRTAGAATTQYHFDRDGRLLAETDGTGAVQRECIHLDGLPLALIDSSGTLYHVHPDHLATPQKMTDGAQAVVWDARHRPFGEAHGIAGTAANDRRFPGQLFDAETGFHYNYYRDYDPGTGRYLQSDPIGLAGGLNTYAYALGNPVINTDPTGEAVPAIIGLCAINPLCRAAAVGAGQLLADALAVGLGIYAMSRDDAPSSGASGQGEKQCESDEDEVERRNNCEALRQSILNTCYGLTGRKRMACFEAANTSFGSVWVGNNVEVCDAGYCGEKTALLVEVWT